MRGSVDKVAVVVNPFGRQKRDKQRRDERAILAGYDTAAIWQRDPSEPVEESNETDYVNATTRLSQRVVKYTRFNLIVEYAIVVSRFVDGQWREVLCIDTCNHGTVHRHRNGNHVDAPEVISYIHDQSAIQESYWESVGEAYDEISKE